MEGEIGERIRGRESVGDVVMVPGRLKMTRDWRSEENMFIPETP